MALNQLNGKVLIILYHSPNEIHIILTRNVKMQ